WPSTTVVALCYLSAPASGWCYREFAKRLKHAHWPVYGARRSGKRLRDVVASPGRRCLEPAFSNENSLDLVKRQFVTTTIIKLRCASGSVVRHRSGLLQRPTVLQIGC